MEKPLALPSPGAGLRVETGVMQFEGDWPGIFIRGDEAVGFAACLIELLRSEPDHMVVQHVFDLGHLLITAHASSSAQEQMKLRLRYAREQFLDSLAERGKL